MRRVVITGIGIVSSIGNDAEAVAASLKEGRSGISFAPDYAEHGFRSQVHGQARPSTPAEHVDKRQMRFMGDGAAFNYLAMEQAIADSGLEPGDVSNERTGLIMGSGGPSTKNLFEAHRIVIEKGSPEADGAVHGHARHVLDQLGLPRDAVQDQGGELLDHLGLLDQRALHRQRRRADPVGQAGHRLRRRRRGARLDAVVPVRRDGRDELEVQRHAARPRAGPTTRRATAS